MKEKIKKIANTYGYDAQRRQCIEEMADVQIMLWQMEYLLIADLNPIIQEKIDRQIQRIEDKS